MRTDVQLYYLCPIQCLKYYRGCPGFVCVNKRKNDCLYETETRVGNVCARVN